MTTAVPLVPTSGELHPVQHAATRVERILRPSNWEKALAARGAWPAAHPISGGTDILLELARSSGPAVTLIDLSAVDGARQIVESDMAFVLGAGVTHNQVVAHGGIRMAALPLAQACLEIGSPQLRNRATVAGNLVTASPANDSISALMALDASVVLSSLISGARADREIPVAEFFTGFRTTQIATDELVTAVRVPKLRPDERGIWVKLGLRRAQAISVVHAALVVGFDADGRAAHGRLALGSVAPTVVLNDVFAREIVGARLGENAAAIAAAVADSIAPIDDGRATADYRRTATATVVDRALHVLDADEAAAQWPDDPPLLGVRSPTRVPGQSELDDDTPIEATVNGQVVSGTSAASSTLLDWLRDHSSEPCLGVKEGCAEGECGACTVQLDGAGAMSCLVAAAQADGAEIVTVEGLSGPGTEGNKLHAIQAAFVEEFAVQCGFCIPGFLVASDSLLAECPDPRDAQIELGLSGNLCRCTGYYPIATAVRVAGSGS